MASYAIAVAAMVVMLTVWVGVQIAWRRVFANVGSDPDALAIRMGCSGCDCKEDAGDPSKSCDGAATRKSHRCSRKRTVPGPFEEEIS